MSDMFNVLAVGAHRVIHRPTGADGPEEAKVAADGIFKMSKDDFGKLGPKGLRAVRRATREDHEAAGSDFNGADGDLFDHDKVAGPGGAVTLSTTSSTAKTTTP